MYRRDSPLGSLRGDSCLPCHFPSPKQCDNTFLPWASASKAGRGVQFLPATTGGSGDTTPFFSGLLLIVLPLPLSLRMNLRSSFSVCDRWHGFGSEGPVCCFAGVYSPLATVLTIATIPARIGSGRSGPAVEDHVQIRIGARSRRFHCRQICPPFLRKPCLPRENRALWSDCKSAIVGPTPTAPLLPILPACCADFLGRERVAAVLPPRFPQISSLALPPQEKPAIIVG